MVTRGTFFSLGSSAMAIYPEYSTQHKVTAPWRHLALKVAQETSYSGYLNGYFETKVGLALVPMSPTSCTSGTPLGHPLTNPGLTPVGDRGLFGANDPLTVALPHRSQGSGD
jgi:hypothetical protein